MLPFVARSHSILAYWGAGFMGVAVKNGARQAAAFEDQGNEATDAPAADAATHPEVSNATPAGRAAR